MFFVLSYHYSCFYELFWILTSFLVEVTAWSWCFGIGGVEPGGKSKDGLLFGDGGSIQAASFDFMVLMLLVIIVGRWCELIMMM